MKVKLIFAKILKRFHKTDSGCDTESPDILDIRVTRQTLEETINQYTQGSVSIVSNSYEAIFVNLLWDEIVEPALKQLERNAVKMGWKIDIFINRRIFNQINRFNRSSSIRTTHPDKTARKITIGWRCGSDTFSYGNTLEILGWKNITHSKLNFDSLYEGLTERLLT